MTESEVQRAERWRREREIDKVAISFGLAYQSHQRGIVYWHAHAQDAFRKGYEAGVVTEREACAQVAESTARLTAAVTGREVRDACARTPAAG